MRLTNPPNMNFHFKCDFRSWLLGVSWSDDHEGKHLAIHIGPFGLIWWGLYFFDPKEGECD